MKKQGIALVSVAFIFCALLTGCADSSAGSDASSVQSGQGQVQTEQMDVENSVAVADEDDVTELTVRFGDAGQPFSMRLEDNDTAAAIARYVGSTEWRLPIYSYDESDVMQYYDIPSRYEIPDSSDLVTQARAGDVFYSDPNRIVLYYHDAEISEEYTKVGTFEADETFISAVENNPVLEGWGNKIVIISDGE